MPDKYIVTLMPEARSGELSTRSMKQAQILILADKGHGDETGAEMLALNSPDFILNLPWHYYYS